MANDLAVWQLWKFNNDLTGLGFLDPDDTDTETPVAYHSRPWKTQQDEK